MNGGQFYFPTADLYARSFWNEWKKILNSGRNGHLEINQLNAHKKYELIIGK